jgi:hypothetical protein
MTRTPWNPPWERAKPAPPPRMNVRAQAGEWVLMAFVEDIRPDSYYLRHVNRSRAGTTIYRDPHYGWTIYDGDDHYSSRRGPDDCLAWWAERHP